MIDPRPGRLDQAGKLSRRDLLAAAARGSVVLATGSFVPGLLGLRALADDSPPGASGPAAGRALVVIELAGGNDGLNTVIPLRSDAYRRLRPAIGVAARDALRLTDDFGLHPALAGLRDLHDDGRLALVHGVGYPSPDRSHFRSMEIWHTARPDAPAGAERVGWLGRAVDACCAGVGAEAAAGTGAGATRPPRLPAVAFGGELPLAMRAERVVVPQLRDPRELRLGGAGEEARLFRALLEGTCEAGDPLAAARAATRGAVAAADDLARLGAEHRPLVPYPDGALAAGLRAVAQMVLARLGTRVFYLGLGGFDTHAGQAGPHARLLGQVGDGVRAFVRDLARQGCEREVLVFAFSEFGRRVEENASAGTDHGAAGPVLLAGAGVRPGLHGEAPSLERLSRGDLEHTCDFRRVYATLLGWLGLDRETVPAVLGGRFEPLPVVA